jgi:hypothetical protein
MMDRRSWGACLAMQRRRPTVTTCPSSTVNILQGDPPQGEGALTHGGGLPELICGDRLS